MSLEQLSKTVDFVQDATPSDANDGETYLDTSQSPPQLKVFDSGANAFIRPRSIQNLDAPVSGAGAAQADIKSGAEGALEQDIRDLTPEFNSVARNLDGGVGAVDWSTKTLTTSTSTTTHKSNTLVNISGSGYLIAITSRPFANFAVEIDGGSVFAYTLENNAVVFYARFDSSVKVTSGKVGPQVTANVVVD